ncbi:MAG TPA: hypothetical protein VL463_07525 [Kofleriaceae bacterium]|nr:hypothetical protein [Kofleriaceae bacterium]
MRSTWILGAVAAAGVTASIVLYVQKRALEDELAQRTAPSIVASNDPWNAQPSEGRDAPAARAPITLSRGSAFTGKTPELAPDKQESRLERRVRRRAEIAAFLGRGEGESADDYRARIVPLIVGGLAKPRADVEDQRRALEAKAGVTPEQHAKLDAAFQNTYDDLLEYTNHAIADGELTPYKTNVSGMLEYAGGLGTILDGAEGKIGTILTPSQQQTFSDSGFEWGEYLGVLAPWEHLDPPPPPH